MKEQYETLLIVYVNKCNIDYISLSPPLDWEKGRIAKASSAAPITLSDQSTTARNFRNDIMDTKCG